MNQQEEKTDVEELREYGYRLLNVDRPSVKSPEAAKALAAARVAIHKIIDTFEQEPTAGQLAAAPGQAGSLSDGG